MKTDDGVTISDPDPFWKRPSKRALRRGAGFGFELPYKAAGTFGETYESRLTALRLRTGLTVQEFAARVGGTVLKKGAMLNPRSAPCEHIARTFGVSPVWLYGGSIAPPRFWPDWWTPVNGAVLRRRAR